jgi:hypothetical protein
MLSIADKKFENSLGKATVLQQKCNRRLLTQIPVIKIMLFATVYECKTQPFS